MVVARLFSGRPWLADPETFIAANQKLTQMGLVKVICADPRTWTNSPLGAELNIDLFEVFMGLFDAYEVPSILERYGLMDRSEVVDIYTRLTDDNAEICFEQVRETSLL